MDTNQLPRYKAELSNDLETIARNPVLSPAYLRRKLWMWLIRAVITSILYVIFWKHEWVRWTLCVTIPLSVLNLLMILLLPSILRKKINRLQEDFIQPGDVQETDSTDD